MRDPAVDTYFETAESWQPELLELRRILLDLDLEERLRWRQPCYAADGDNIAILGRRKANCVLSFFRGALLSDPDGVLSAPGPNSRAGRVLNFTSVEEVHAAEARIRAFVAESIKHRKAGTTIEPVKPVAEDWPAELVEVFAEDPEMEAAFTALTPGRQRGYLLLFNGAKQSKTRTRRVREARARIMLGKGRHDCICGRSKKMPRCDGSHQYI